MSDAAQILLVERPKRRRAIDEQAAQARKAALVKAIRAMVDAGNYQPTLKQIAHASGSYLSAAVDVFGSKRGLMTFVARHYAAAVVDTLQLSDKARAALSDREVKQLAMAVLGGRRLEAGQ